MAGRGVLALELQRGGDEALEQGVRTVRAALELGVELRAQMEIAARDLHSLHKASVRAGTGDDQTLLLELGAELVVELMPDQQGVETKGGTMRLGKYPCVITPGTKMADCYGTTEIDERHRHRYELASA